MKSLRRTSVFGTELLTTS